MVRAALLTLWLAVAALPAAAASPLAFVPVPEESQLSFEAVQNNVPVKGEFRRFTADIAFHPDALEASKVVVTVDMASAFTSYGEIVSTLKTGEWFDSLNHPAAVFETQSFTALGDNRYAAASTLTLKGRSQPVILNFTLHEFSPEGARMTGEALLKRTDFGIGWADTVSVKDEVKVMVEITAAPAE